jgi:hypothetical protein
MIRTRLPIFFSVAVFLVLLNYPAAWPQPIQKYAVYFASCSPPRDTSPSITLRSFERDGKRFFLSVDCGTLDTRVIERDDRRCKPGTLKVLRNKYARTPYALALDKAERTSAHALDAGIVRGEETEHGFDLTADLCPSKRPLERTFFTDLLRMFLPEEKPVPIAVAVTGNWMYKHRDDLQWLRSLADSGELAITWINHSYNHRFRDSVPLERNFLADTATDLNVEVLDTERKMLENGITPSVFFRFPGLVSDSLVFRRITAYGLIPVGSDAWIAKNQNPRNGSIVLVHANGNEPYGIKRFFELLKEHRDSITAGRWLLYDLRGSVASEAAPRAGDHK